jgi:hypothetical protein
MFFRGKTEHQGAGNNISDNEAKSHGFQSYDKTHVSLYKPVIKPDCWIEQNVSNW